MGNYDKSLGKVKLNDIYSTLHIRQVSHLIIEGTEVGWAKSAFEKSALTVLPPCPSLTMEKTSRRIYSIIFLGTKVMLTRLQIPLLAF